MAIKRLVINGYGQLELNQVAFRRDGRIEAQCKLHKDIKYVENGMILAIDPAKREVNYGTDASEFFALNYTTEHMYDERAKALKDFKLDNGTFLPRLGYLAKGDKFTTNCISIDTTEDEVTEEVVHAIVCDDTTGDNGTVHTWKNAYGHLCENGSILVNTTPTNAKVKVVKETTMPDGAPAINFIAL